MIYYKEFEVSEIWHSGVDDFKVRGISLFTVCQLYIFQLLAPALATNSQSGSFVKHLKTKGLDWHFKFANCLLGGGKVVSNTNGIKIATLYDTHNNAMVDVVNSVSAELANHMCNVLPIVSDRKIAKRVVGNTIPVGYSTCYSLIDELECQYTWRNNLTKLLSAIDSLWGHACLFSHVDIDFNIIKQYLLNFMKQTIRDIIALDNLYKRINPNVVVMGSDSHKLGRITALLGELFSFKTIVLQHGAPMLPHAYVPVYSNWIAVWGDSFKDWFIKHNVPPDKIIVTGCPRFDSYSSKVSVSNKQKLIWLTTPANDEIVHKSFDLISPLLSDLDLELIVKTHPSEPDNIYQTLIDSSGYSNCMVCRDIPIVELINKNDIVFCLNSTAGIEAIALGAALFVFKFDSVPNAIPYDKYEVAKYIYETSDIVAEYQAFHKHMQTVKYINNVNLFLNNYIGLLDGLATKRVCDFILRNAIQL